MTTELQLFACLVWGYIHISGGKCQFCVSRKSRQACTTSQNQCMSQNIQVLTVIVYFCEKPQFFVWKTAVFSQSLKWYPSQADNTLPEAWERINILSQSVFNMLPRIPLGSACDGGKWFRVTGSCQACLMAVCQRLALRGGLVGCLWSVAHLHEVWRNWMTSHSTALLPASAKITAKQTPGELSKLSE